jgi:hypothetical protein
MDMSRPTQEMVEDNLITWQCAMYELHREIDKLDQELSFSRPPQIKPTSKVNVSRTYYEHAVALVGKDRVHIDEDLIGDTWYVIQEGYT